MNGDDDDDGDERHDVLRLSRAQSGVLRAEYLQLTTVPSNSYLQPPLLH